MSTTANVPTQVDELTTIEGSVSAFADSAMSETGGLLRLTPNWVPRSFLQPGKRLKLHPDDLYAFGLSRGGIDERWFGSTTEAANEGRVHDEGLSYVQFGSERALLKDIVSELGGAIIGEDIFGKYGKWPVYSKFFDNMGPIPHHMHQNAEQAALVGQEGKPESYYFPPQHNNVGNNFPYTFFGFAPGTTKQEIYDCIANWQKGDNGILNYSQAAKLEVGTGWLVDPCILHAPGSLCTYEPQWASDVFGMYQNLVEGREVPWSLLVKDMPEAHHQDVDFILGQLDWEGNVDPEFKKNHHLKPVVHTEDEGHVDKWIVYGTIKEMQYFSAKELTVKPGASVTITDPGATSVIVVAGEGHAQVQGQATGLNLDCPKLIRFRDLTQDEFFVTSTAAAQGVTYTNRSTTEDLVMLRYFGPEVQKDAPEIGSA